MGSGRDKRKKAKERKEGPLPGKGLEKTEVKTAKNETKRERRTLKKLEGNEDDLDALLAKFALEDKQRQAVQIEADCAPPSARVNASFIPFIAPKINDIILFGGECTELETGKVRVFKDLYRFNCDKQKWTRIVSPNSPAPRCAHQAVIYKYYMYVFGGEITSPNQEKFHHYKELWRLDLTTYEWDLLPSKGGPTARSGHRMALHKNRVILFGGFYDNGREVKYNNELWVLDLEDLKWHAVGNASAGVWPTPRGGFQMVVNGDTLFLYGGYSKIPDDEDEDLEHGKVHDDMWALDLNKFVWERIKKAGMAPNPRASFAMVTHKARALLFGGVSDNEAKGGEDLSSEFHNDMYNFNFEKRRWFAAELRPPKKADKTDKGVEGSSEPAAASSSAAARVGTDSKADSSGTSSAAAASAEQTPAARQAAAPGGHSGSSIGRELDALIAAGNDKGSAIYKAAVRIQSRFRGYMVRKAYKTYQLGGAISELLYSPAAYGLDMSQRNMPKPRARISPQVCVVQGQLWLFGGIVEVGDKEITLDDMWCLDLNKMDGWQLIKENTVGEEAFKQGEVSSSDYETASDDD